MSIPYQGNAANVAQSINGANVTEPQDADPRNAASITPALSTLADFEQLLLEQVHAMQVSNWKIGTIASSEVFMVASRTGPYDGVSGGGAGRPVRWAAATDKGIFTSHDGDTWTLRTGAIPFSTVYYAPGVNKWLACSSTNGIYTSPDGVTWTQQDAAKTDVLAFFYSSDLALYVGVGTAGHIYTSPDSATWTARVSNVTTDLYTIGVAPGPLLVAITNGSSNLGSSKHYTTSPDGVTWTQRTMPGGAGNIGASGYNGGSSAAGTRYFMVIDATYTVWTTPDGLNWTQGVTIGCVIGVADFISPIASNGNSWMLCFESGQIISSVDGRQWASRPAFDAGNGVFTPTFAFGDATLGCYFVSEPLAGDTANGIARSLFGGVP